MGAAVPHRWQRVLGRLAKVGALPTDSREKALRKEALVLAASLTSLLAVAWVVTYATLGLYLPAILPFIYQVVTAINLMVFARTKRYRFFRASQLGLTLLLPFVLQLSLGGFVKSSGVVLWAFTAPLGALLFGARPDAVRWFLAFLGLMVLVGVLDPILSSSAIEVPNSVVIVFSVLNVLGVTGTCYFLMHYTVRERDIADEAIESERERSERLLLNVLPQPIAERLKSGESLIADGAPEVGVLFADIVGFTPLSETMPPDDVVALLNRVFTVFDELAAEHGMEKIKTIGDAYMAASGLLVQGGDHVYGLGHMALAMQREIGGVGDMRLRIGIDIGPVVAGVIGRKKFSYDLWGDTVNTASRMESHGLPGTIQVTERAHARLCSAFELEERGIVEVKGKGPMLTYVLVGAKVSDGAAPRSALERTP